MRINVIFILKKIEKRSEPFKAIVKRFKAEMDD